MNGKKSELFMFLNHVFSATICFILKLLANNKDFLESTKESDQKHEIDMFKLKANVGKEIWSSTSIKDENKQKCLDSIKEWVSTDKNDNKPDLLSLLLTKNLAIEDKPATEEKITNVNDK